MSLVRNQVANWTRERGHSPRLYPGALVWCTRKPGRDLREQIELWLAWQRVFQEVKEGVLGVEFERADHAEVQAKVKEAEEAAREGVWAGYRFVALADTHEPHGLKIIDLGAGHASASETLCGRIVSALKTEGLLNENVGAGYIDRHWPPALKESGAWPLTSLRQSFLNGTLTRLIDPDAVLRERIVEFVGRGDFGLASGVAESGQYERTWYAEPLGAEEVTFESNVLLLTKARAERLRAPPGAPPRLEPTTDPEPEAGSKPVAAPESSPGVAPEPVPDDRKTALRLAGTVPPEVWNRLGTRVLPKLRSGEDLSVTVEFSMKVSSALAKNVETDLRQILNDLGLADRVRVERP